MLSNVRRYLDVVRGLGATLGDAFLDAPDRVGNAKDHLVIAIECCIDIANHAIASARPRLLGGGRPARSRDPGYQRERRRGVRERDRGTRMVRPSVCCG
jgi:hypothetical protein